MYAGIERRIFHRIEGEIAVRYRQVDSKEGCSVTTKNISAGGMRISLLKKIEPGTVLDLEIFRGRSNASSRCRGRIMWVQRLPLAKNKGKKYFEAGIEFIGLSFMYLGGLIEDLKTQNQITRLSSTAI